MPGKKFSGITTIEDLKGRCIVDEFTDCWHWQGASSTDKCGRKLQRVWIFDSLRQEFRTMSGPMAVLELEGTRTAKTEMGWRARCTSEDCMNPAHIMGGTKQEWGNWMRATGSRKNKPSITAANRKNVRSRAILNEGKASELKARAKAGESPAALAAEYGLKNPRYVNEVVLGKRWKNTVLPGASVFTLGAR